MFRRVAFAAAVFSAGWAGCLENEEPAPSPTTSAEATATPPTGPFDASSSAFQPQQRIPRRYTCDETNQNPALAFANLPANATHIALIMEDPDVPSRAAPQRVVTHWTFWNLPRANATIAASTDPKTLGARVGQPYGGPCPPPGSGEHRYFFYSFAQTKPLAIGDGSTSAQIRDALKGNVGATAVFYGLYSRPCVSPVCN